MRRFATRFLAASVLFGSLVSGSIVYPSVCDQAASVAAKKHAVPLQMLRALARVESGRTTNGVFGPWPWAVNLDGAGTWFSTRQDASFFLRAAVQNGIENFDVGCFQINNLWHGHAFSGPDQMLDPQRNADYAARFLKSLFFDAGSWDIAIGHFHSRTPDKAARYKARFDAVYAKLPPDPFETDVQKVPRDNSFPLFVIGHSRANGSLVPHTDRRSAFFTKAQPLFQRFP